MEYSFETFSTGHIPVGLSIFYFAVIAISAVAMWKIYAKAGQDGWKSLIPFYNIYVMTKILNKPTRWFWGMFVPFMNIVVMFIWIFVLPFELAKKFNKSSGFGLGLMFLGPIFYAILGFGKAEYVGIVEKEEKKDKIK